MHHNTLSVQHNTSVNTISNTSKIDKIVHPDFSGEDGGTNPHHSDSEN